MSTDQTFPDAEILSRVIAPQEGSLPQSVAGELLKLSFPPTDVERMNALAEKNRLDQLTESEQSELSSYLRVGSLLDAGKPCSSRFWRTVQDAILLVRGLCLKTPG